jgi:transposase-like protein
MNLAEYSCSNEQCSFYGQANSGNISIRARYGKNNDRILLYCRSCGSTFAATRNTALFGMHLPQETVSQLIHLTAEGLGIRAIGRVLNLDPTTVIRVTTRTGDYCATILSQLLISLSLSEVQLDELWTFIKKNAVRRMKKSLKSSVKPGSGQP